MVWINNKLLTGD